MHVAIVLRDLPMGGVERVMLGLADGLVVTGDRVTLLVSSRTGALAHAVPDGVEVVALGGPSSAWDDPAGAAQAVWRLAVWLRANRPDAVVSAKEQANAACLAARRMAGVDPVLFRTRHLPPSRSDARWLGLPGRPHDRVVAVSHELAAQLQAVVAPGTAITVLPNPVLPSDWPFRATDTPDHPWFDAEVPLAVCVGRLAEQKGQDVLVAAMSFVARPLRLVLVGDGPDRDALQAQVTRLGLEDRVQLVGAVDDGLPWIGSADLVVLPSRQEGLPGALVEALACGRRVVATSCPTGPRELLGDRGVLVTPGDPVALARGIGRALDGPPPAFDPSPYTVDGAVAVWRAALRSAIRGSAF